MFRIFCLMFLMMIYSCNPYKALRTDRFSYTENGLKKTLELKVPKGFTKEKNEVDSAGSEKQTFRYANGAELYFMHLASPNSYPDFDTANHIGKQQLHGGLFYKEQDAAQRFWREVFVKNFRFGYRHAKIDKQEALLDSALNFVRVE